MFIESFLKHAAVLATTLSPEKLYELEGEKDKYMGAAIGAPLGAVVGALKGKKGSKAVAALAGGAAGHVAGAAAAHAVGKLYRKHQARKLRRIYNELNLRATPHRMREREE